MLLTLAVFVASCSLTLAVAPVWSPSGCGISQYADAGEMELPAVQIVGGIEARPYEFPWQVSVRRKSTNDHFCGGIVISDFWIMCAAHCMTGEQPGQVSIVVGEHQRSATSTVRQTLDVASIHVHENYNPLTYQNDISLIKVATAIVLSADVQPACAPDPDNLYTYSKSQCSGWGTVSSGGFCCTDILRYVTLNITENSFCDAVYTRDQIFDDMICASDNYGGNQRDSCQGDSGGPLTVKESDGTFRVVGIVSWGIGCASGYPGVYSRSGYFADWVTGIINAN